MRSNPFEDLEELLDRLSNEVEEGMTEHGGLRTPRSAPTDVVDTGEEFVVTVDVAGFDTDDIHLTLSEDVLQLEASRSDESYQEGRYIRRERTKNTINRRIRLPEPVEEDGVTATSSNGVLTIKLPKTDPDEGTKQIDIE